MRSALSSRIITVKHPGQTPEDRDSELKARLDKLSGDINSETAVISGVRKTAGLSRSSSTSNSAMGAGLRVGSELVAGVLVGGFLGWWLDRWLGTSPLGLLVMLFLGMAAGFWNVYRVAARPTGSAAAQNDKPSPPANRNT